MKPTIKTTEQLNTFNIHRTLLVIEKEKDIFNYFKTKSKLDLNMVKTLASSNLLKDETKELLEEIFEFVILADNNFKEVYESTADVKEEKLSIADIKEPLPKDAIKPPRRYGKDKIMVDIEKQGGKSTETQKAMLAVNEMKNICVKLAARGVKDMVTGSQLLSERDCREIKACVEILNKRLESILKRKK